MDESVIIARRRQEALDRAAQILGVRPPMPSAKDEPGLREAYMAELILALAERVSGEPRSKEAGVASGSGSRISDKSPSRKCEPCVASPRLYMRGYVPGGRSENINPPSQE
jgi:hypothetical protein